MPNLYAFMSDSPCLSFLLAWIAAWVIVTPIRLLLRSINVAINGWPPRHLDADGDHKNANLEEPAKS